MHGTFTVHHVSFYESMPIQHPFTSFSEDEFRILDVKPCEKEYLFHSTAKSLVALDPIFNAKHAAYGSVHEYGAPVVFATDKPSNAFCYRPSELYAQTRERYGTSVYHRLTHENHKILLGAHLQGFIYVISGKDFYEVLREDLEVGQWTRSTEWITDKKVTPLEKIEVTKPYDWEMIPEYEFLGSEYVGEMSAEQYLSLATDENVKRAIRECICKPFIPCIPEPLKKFLL